MNQEHHMDQRPGQKPDQRPEQKPDQMSGQKPPMEQRQGKPGGPPGKPAFITGFITSCIVSLVVGFCMTIAVMLYNGQPPELVPILMQGGLATIIGIVVMLLPVVPLADRFAAFYGANPHGLLGGILSSIVTTTVMTFCISFGMTAFATGFETFPDGSSFIVRWLTPIVHIWGTAYLATILALPVAVAIAPKGQRPPTDA